MACSVTLSNYSLGDCFSSLGGVKTVWVANYVENAVSATTSGETISSFVSGITWYKQELRKNTGSMTSTLNVSENANYVSTEVLIEYTKMQKESRIQMNALAKGDLMAVVLDKNGNYYFLGEEEEVTASAGDGQTGQNRDDKNAYTITLTDSCSHFPRMLDDSAIVQLG